MKIKFGISIGVFVFFSATFSAVSDAEPLSCPSQTIRPLRTIIKRKGFLIGAAVSYEALVDKSDPHYSSTLAQEFNALSPENSMKFNATEPKRNVFDFKKMDALAQFASDHKMALHAHCLVWHEAIPKWLSEKPFSPEELRAILQNHITQVARHLREKFPSLDISWDVVNEAVDPDSTDKMRKTLWSSIANTPEESIALAFQWAHQADPKAELYYNDYGAEGAGKKSDLVFGLVSRLKKKGVPIYGLGLQSHFWEGVTPSASELATNFARYAAIGVKLQITEMDYRLKNPSAISPIHLSTQAEVFETVLKACYEAPNCIGFTTWGFTDRHSWIPAHTNGKSGAALPINENYQAKPTYCRMNRLLGE